MKKMSRAMALLLTVAMMFSLVTIAGFASTEGVMTISSPNAVLAGATNVKVDVKLDTNPGITYMKATFSYDDSALELVSVTDKGLLGSYLGYNGTTNTKNVFSWQNGTAPEDFTATGTIVEMVFNVKAGTAVGDYAIGVEIDAENTFNFAGDPVSFAVTPGKITVIEETNITAVEATPASVNVAYGADAAAINAALSAVKVLGDGATTGGTTVTDLDVTSMASAWDIAAVDTTKVAAHKATATLAASANGINIAESARAIEVTVNVDPLTVATADALVDVTVKKGAEGTDAAVKQAIIEGNAAITLKDAATGATDTVALTAEMITVADATDAAETVLDTSAAGNKTTADIKLAAGTESANKTFKLAEELTVDTVEISVKSSGSYTPSGIGKPIGGGNANFGGGVTEDKKTEDGETTEDGKTEDGETTEDGKTEDGETTEDGKTEDGEVAGVEFADVAADYWAADYITTLKDMGIINGKAEGKFEPEAQLTRAEFAKMIAVAMNLTATATESTFTDCGADDWYTPFVIAVNEAGFVNGKGDAFDANGSISRQEICTILGRIVGATEGAALTFADAANVADWAADGVAAMVSLGVVNGYEDNTFKGAANATRAEVSKMLVAFLTATAETPAE